MTNEQTLEVVIQHVRAAVAEAQDDDGVVTIKAEMLSLLLEELAPGGSQTQPNIAAAESGTGAASSVEPTARIDIARWSSSQYLGAPKAGDICTYCGEQWLQDPGGGAGIWHNCHT